MKKDVIDSILVFEREIVQRNERSLGYCVTLLLRWQPSKIGFTSFNVVARRFLMNHAQVLRTQVPRCPGATTEDNAKKIRDLVLSDRRLKVREIAEIVSISKDCVVHTLQKILGMRRLSGRWVPRLLTPNNKRNRETTSEQCLTLFKRNSKDFLRRFVAVDETWIHWYTPETKEHSK